MVRAKTATDVEYLASASITIDQAVLGRIFEANERKVDAACRYALAEHDPAVLDISQERQNQWVKRRFDVSRHERKSHALNIALPLINGAVTTKFVHA